MGPRRVAGLIRIFTLKMEPGSSVHGHGAEPGRQQTTEQAHIHPLKRRIADRGVSYMLSRCEEIGPCSGAWALAMHRHRPIESIRVMQGLLVTVARVHPHEELDRAAGKAPAARRLAAARTSGKRWPSRPNVVQVDFLETHPLIREMAAYRIPFPP